VLGHVTVTDSFGRFAAMQTCDAPFFIANKGSILGIKWLKSTVRNQSFENKEPTWPSCLISTLLSWRFGIGYILDIFFLIWPDSIPNTDDPIPRLWSIRKSPLRTRSPRCFFDPSWYQQYLTKTCYILQIYWTMLILSNTWWYLHATKRYLTYTWLY
jgi:hypothetical protein